MTKNLIIKRENRVTPKGQNPKLKPKMKKKYDRNVRRKSGEGISDIRFQLLPEGQNPKTWNTLVIIHQN